MRTIYILIFIATFLFSNQVEASTPYQPRFSVAGLFDLPQSGRQTIDFNVGWRFKRAALEGAEKTTFNDSDWELVSTPHTVQLMPAEASGCRNYQGPAWYRKHFVVDKSLKDKQITLYFEAVMGKTTVYVNGQQITQHFGGYLPFSIELNKLGIQAGDSCLIAVLTDNSDDKSYPPGKKQSTLDFTYHGGIYRDVWMIATDQVHLTDPNQANQKAGGGVFIHYGSIDKQRAEIFIDTEINNESNSKQAITLLNTLKDHQGAVVKRVKTTLTLQPKERKQIKQQLIVNQPTLWTPDAPTLYNVETQLIGASKKPLDGGVTRIGIRKPEFRGKEGFWLNGIKENKLIGGNRHQDYAYVGNAVPNSQHWRDAFKLREAGCRVIRVAHYPQDPSFMDACDELGLFVIVATPGWQYWNKDPQFAELVYSDIRNMIRRDRNHPSVLMWEPILNETQFPLEFSLKAHQTAHEEYPYPGCFCAADSHSAGVAENYEVVYGWPKEAGTGEKAIFTREFGENVDDWYAHNNNNRAARNWGELPQLTQAKQLTIAYNELYIKDPQFIGGALWHPFDHQRGYHPDPYWGGLLDAFRQPKYAFELFKSQRDAAPKHPFIETDYTLFVAHELSPFSSPDVTIFTNCDAVRLILFETDTLFQQAPKDRYNMPHPPIVFQNIFDFNKMRIHSYTEKNWKKVSIVAEGLVNGKVVCTTKKMPSRRSTKLKLSIDNVGQQLIANGSDFIPIICEVTDDEGNVRRAAKEQILFTVTGEGELIGDAQIGANPRAVEFGSAPILVRSSLVAGEIKVHAQVLFEGEHAPTPTTLVFNSIASNTPFNYVEVPMLNTATNTQKTNYKRQLTEEEKKKALDEVEKQQTQFGQEAK